MMYRRFKKRPVFGVQKKSGPYFKIPRGNKISSQRGPELVCLLRLVSRGRLVKEKKGGEKI